MKECGTEITQRGVKLFPNNYNSCLNPNCTIKSSLSKSQSTTTHSAEDSKVIAPWEREIPMKEKKAHLKPAPPGTTALIQHGFVSKSQKNWPPSYNEKNERIDYMMKSNGGILHRNYIRLEPEKVELQTPSICERGTIKNGCIERYRCEMKKVKLLEDWNKDKTSTINGMSNLCYTKENNTMQRTVPLSMGQTPLF